MPDISTMTQEEQQTQSLSTAAARNLSTTTKSTPQMQEISSRWLLKVLPWTQTNGGVYRVNRRMTYTIGDGRVTFTNVGTEVRVVPPELRELPALRTYEDDEVLQTLAERFVQQEYQAGAVIVEPGGAIDEVYLIAHGKADKVGSGEYGDETILGVLADGQYFGDEALVDGEAQWNYAVKAVTPCTVMMLPRQSFDDLMAQSEDLREHIENIRGNSRHRQNQYGEAEIAMSAGHSGEIELPGTFVDYEMTPREYELSVAQTVLRVHTRVADLYNEPMNQLEQQLRLTIEALKERQEHELVNNKEFGLLHNADFKQRISTHTGPPTPDDLDELLCRRRDTNVILAHPKAIAAIGRECNKRGLYPQSIDFHGNMMPTWRGVPVLPCNKIPVTENQTSSIIAMRLGEDNQGVIGLHQTGIPDEYEPGLSVRFMNISEKAIMSYLVSAYYSAAVLVPDALGVLENVEIGRRD